MPEIRSFTKSFAGGELTPEYWGRIDDDGYQTGLAACRNFFILPHGPAANRPGTQFVRAVKDSTKAVRLIPFAYSTDQTMVLEFGEEYVRFHTLGQTLMDGLDPYEVATPYLAADLFSIKYVQSADVLTLTHPGYEPQELRRNGAIDWEMTPIGFAPTMAAPATPTVVADLAGGTTGQIEHTYQVTAVAEDGVEESDPSGTSTQVLNNLDVQGANNQVTWTAVTGAYRYNVYRYDGGMFGFIGQTDALTFRDDNFTPDLSRTPPENVNPFDAVDEYPGAVSYYEQRRSFAGSANKPQNLWMTRSGTESNLGTSIPTRDDDAILFRIASRENNTIRHIVPLQDLLLLTSSAELRVTSEGGALTASSFSVKPQSYVGANDMQPIIANQTVLYGAARGGHMREMGFSSANQGYNNGDLSLRAPHLFDNKRLVDQAFAKSPYPIVWVISSDGTLLGLTYVPEQKVAAWHRHDTDGLFESVAVVAEGDEDAVYVVVQREVDGASVRYVERFASRQFEDLPDAFFVDCGLTYEGAPITTVTGLDHLEGKEVVALGDGAVRPRMTVSGGQVTLDQPASKLHVGLPIQADLWTMPLAFDAPGMGQGRQKNVNQVWLRVYRSGGFMAGPNLDKLTAAKIRTTEPFGSPPSLQTREIGLRVQSDWADGGQLYIRNDDPTPLTIASLSLGVAVGGG